jgi:hypothetical protein
MTCQWEASSSAGMRLFGRLLGIQNPAGLLHADGPGLGTTGIPERRTVCRRGQRSGFRQVAERTELAGIFGNRARARTGAAPEGTLHWARFPLLRVLPHGRKAVLKRLKLSNLRRLRAATLKPPYLNFGIFPSCCTPGTGLRSGTNRRTCGTLPGTKTAALTHRDFSTRLQNLFRNAGRRNTALNELANFGAGAGQLIRRAAQNTRGLSAKNARALNRATELDWSAGTSILDSRTGSLTGTV